MSRKKLDNDIEAMLQGILRNTEGYESLTRDQLLFKIKITRELIKKLINFGK